MSLLGLARLEVGEHVAVGVGERGEALPAVFAPALVVSLKEGGTVPTREAFVTTVCQGRKDKGMPSWCELGLEMDKIMGIYAYVKGRADGKIREGRPAVRENS